MRLADFISRDMEPIPAQWAAFAANLLPVAADMGSLGLPAVTVQATMRSAGRRSTTSPGMCATPHTTFSSAPVCDYLYVHGG
jgi:hypothetical protein